MGLANTKTWRLNALFIAVFVLLTYVLLLASMTKNNTTLAQHDEVVSVDKKDLIALSNYDKLITTVLLKPKSFLYQGKIFITLEQRNAQVSLLSFEKLLTASLIDITLPFIALFVMALTSVVLNAFYYSKKVNLEVEPLCHKVDNIINTYQLNHSTKKVLEI